MCKKYSLLLVFLLSHFMIAKAGNTIDSIGVENHQGKKVILYKVETKETYFSIAKKYNLHFREVMDFNESKPLQPGIVIKVPTGQPFNNTASNTGRITSESSYTVVAKDNLHLIAQKFGTSVEEIKQLNQLSGNNLRIGQVLLIPSSGNPSQVPPVPIQNPIPVSAPATSNRPQSHTVKARENLHLIAQRYQLSVDDLKRINRLTNNQLQVGQVLLLQEDETPSVTGANTVTNPSTTSPVTNPAANDIIHTVASGETIYAIARKYSTTTYQIQQANNLNSNNLTVGQQLTIKNVSKANPSAPLPAGNLVTSTSESHEEGQVETIKDPSLRLPASRYGLSQVDEKGTAVWISDPDLDPNKMLILHRTAPVGTIMKITNPMTNRSAFAKVVGKFTENESTKDVIVVMTKAVADAVGALDKRFFCNLNYGSVENEQ